MTTLSLRVSLFTLPCAVALWLSSPFVSPLQAVGAFVAMAYVEASVAPTPSTTSGTSAGNLSLSAGDTVAVFTVSRDQTVVPTISDGNGNTYAHVCAGATITEGAETFTQDVYLANVTVGGSTAISGTYSTSSARFLSIYASQYRGFATAAADQCHGAGANAQTSFSSGSVTTTQASEWLIGGVVTTTTPTIDATYTSRLSHFDGVLWLGTLADKSVAATGSYAFTGTMGSGDYLAAILTLKLPGGGGATPRQLTLVGVGGPLAMFFR